VSEASREGGLVAIYAGSFDPPTRGHLDIITRAARMFPRLVVAIGVHPTRKPLFTGEERVELLRACTAGLAGVEVEIFRGLLVERAAEVGATVIVRGLRSVVDFDYEMPIAQANADMRPAIETIFLPTRPADSFVSASIVREIAGHGGDVTRLVHPAVAAALRAKLAG
jgi:pantetheine-phosphate adenylyltransferase